jgi:hypothetical protein
MNYIIKIYELQEHETTIKIAIKNFYDKWQLDVVREFLEDIRKSLDGIYVDKCKGRYTWLMKKSKKSIIKLELFNKTARINENINECVARIQNSSNTTYIMDYFFNNIVSLYNELVDADKRIVPSHYKVNTSYNVYEEVKLDILNILDSTYSNNFTASVSFPKNEFTDFIMKRI